MSIQLVKEKQDLTYLSWSVYRNSSGTAGSFLKSYSELGGKKVYYKLSNFDKVQGVIGHECVNELIVDRLLTILGIPHLPYQLIHADIMLEGEIHDVYLCASEDFKEKGESKIALDAYKEREAYSKESALDFCVRMGWETYIYQMLVVDYLILNRDRHGANIEVLRNSRKKTLHLAPLFDHGLSLLCRCMNDSQVEAIDVMEDKLCNNFIGSRSTWENLKLIPADKMPKLNPLCESDRATIMEGLDGIISGTLQDKIWEMIWKRWCAYEDFCNSR
ncbi:MAG: hypothetical protein IKB01_11780 [Lachnospiraceae bacterium]|nr:hypothetical protein [Lachnospiraceae bacterium]MBR3761324.1 hypothetical protein [Lachnospiraceae bacterium]